MTKDYYGILGLQAGAEDDEIRRAFRALVKQYHPDLNSHPGAREKFMEIHEAYECLSDPGRRRMFDARRGQRKISQEELLRRERIYQEWVWNQQELARKRASAYASAPFQEYRNSRWYRVALGVSRIYNVLFVIFCLGVIIIPLWRYAEQQDLPEVDQRSFAYFAIPVIAGLIFAAWGYYYWFILDHDEK